MWQMKSNFRKGKEMHLERKAVEAITNCLEKNLLKYYKKNILKL